MRYLLRVVSLQAAISMVTFDWRRSRHRFDFRSSKGEQVTPRAGRRRKRATRVGMAIIGTLTVWLLAWLVYRWLVRPAWLGLLPGLLAELVALIETAGAFTLAVLWSGIGLRYWRQSRDNGHSFFLQPLTIEQLQEINPKEFERFVATLFRRKGYRVTMRGGKGDHGVDLELESPQGREAIVQCKRYRSTVGEKVVRDLYGTLLHEKVVHAFLVTTADISDAAREWARGKPITLIDGGLLAKIVLVMAQESE